MSWQPIDLAVDDDLELFTVDPAQLFAELQLRPAWHDRAACRGVGPDLFFTTDGQPTADALALCNRCPVLAECHREGAGQRHGVWAGTGEAERRRGRAEVA